MKNIFRYNHKTLSFEKLSSKTYIRVSVYAVLIFSILFYLGRISGTSDYIKSHVFNRHTDTLHIQNEPFTRPELIKLLKGCHIKYPYIVLAQAEHESGHFTSRLFKSNNNMFGMKKARQRITTAHSEKNAYANYRNWIECVHDYAMYQSTIISKISDEDEYFEYLSNNYAEDTLYVRAIKILIKSEHLKTLFE